MSGHVVLLLLQEDSSAGCARSEMGTVSRDPEKGQMGGDNTTQPI